VRKRLFLVFAVVVHRVWTYLARWRCPRCLQTFTSYPEFALPYKRYPQSFIVERCAAYVEDRARTYDEGVKEEGQPISHEDADAGMELPPSALWRWVTALGGYSGTVDRALDLIKQKDPSTPLFRALAGLGRIRAGKFRSPEREMVLQNCRKLALVAREYARLFNTSLPTEFEKAHGLR
jgi:hypothetical protein